MSYSLTRATTWNLAGYIYLIVASLVSTPILLETLGVTLFGQYILIIATLSLLSAFDLGLPQAVVRALVRTTNLSERQHLWATSSRLFVLTGLVTALLAVGILSRLSLSPAILALVFCVALLNNLVSHYSTLPQSTGHFGYYNVKTFVVGTGNTLLSAYLASASFVAIFYGLVITYLLTLFTLAYFSLKYFPRPWTYAPKTSIARSLISFGLRNQVGKIAGQIQAQYAKYLLATVSSLVLSAYSIATGLIQKAAGAVTQLATALYPQVSTRPVRSLYYRLQLGLLALALLGVGLYHLFGYQFLSWWLNDPSIVHAVDQALVILVWSFVLLIPTPLASTVLDGLGHPGTTSLFAVLTTILEITLALLLFPTFHFLAPAYASLLSLAITTPVLLYAVERRLSQVKSNL